MIADAIRHLASDALARGATNVSSRLAAQRSPRDLEEGEASASRLNVGEDSATTENERPRWRKDGEQRRATSVLQALGRKLDPQDKGQIKQAATQMAATLFFQPLLQEMRKLDQGAKFVHGGRGEDVFGEQLDTRLADTIAASNPGGITAKVASKLERAADKHRHAENGVPQASWATMVQAAQKD